MSRLARQLPAVYGVIHAVVDASSVMVVYAGLRLYRLPPAEAFYLVVAYNVLAFGTQVFFGAATDKVKRPRVAAQVGLGMVVLATLALRLDPIVAVTLGGLGNACFHVGAGAITLRVNPRRATPLGVFVAPGAVGLAFGMWFGKGGSGVVWPFTLTLVLCLVATLFLPKPRYPYDMRPSPESGPDREPGAAKIEFPKLIVALLLFSIMVRSTIGFAGCYHCPKNLSVLVGLTVAAFAGKAMGGIVSDRFGWLETSVGALLLSAPLIAFGGTTWVAVVAGMFVFQMTMPVTLAAVALVHPGRPAFAFGMTCFALLLGALPTYHVAMRAYYGPPAFLVLIMVAAVAVYAGLRLLGDANPVKGFLRRGRG